MDSLPDSMSKLTKMQLLDISYNRFKEVPIQLKNLPNLEVLPLQIK